MPAAPPIIDDDMVSFLRGPVSIQLGTADAMAVPDATRVAGAAALDGRRLRVLILANAGTARANAVIGARAAVLATDITTYRSLQWKGEVVALGDRTPGDLAVVHHHVDTVCRISPSVGVPSHLAARLYSLDVVPVVIEVASVFDQTPGPGAGRPIGAPR